MSMCSRVCGMMPPRRRDHERMRVDAGRSSQHVLDEALVPGHPPRRTGDRSARSETQSPGSDRDPALLLLFQPIGVDAGQHLDEERLAVVDVSGATDDGGRDMARVCYSSICAEIIRSLRRRSR